MRLSRQTKSDLLRNVPLFSRCSRKQLAAIAQLADELDLRVGKELTVQGKPAREFFILLSGAAVVRRNGRKLRVLGAGDLIGEIALLTGGPRTATVTVTEPTRVLVLTARAFRSLLRDSPEIAVKVLAVVSERLNDPSSL